MANAKRIDGRECGQSTVEDVIAFLTQLVNDHADGDMCAVYVTDRDGNPIERLTMFEETLTDNRKALGIELNFVTDAR